MVGLVPRTAPPLAKQKASAAKQAKHVAQVFRVKKADVPHPAARKDTLAHKQANAANHIAQKVVVAARVVPQGVPAHAIKNAVPSSAIKAAAPKEAELCYAIQPNACNGIQINGSVARAVKMEQAVH